MVRGESPDHSWTSRTPGPMVPQITPARHTKSSPPPTCGARRAVFVVRVTAAVQQRCTRTITSTVTAGRRAAHRARLIRQPNETATNEIEHQWPARRAANPWTRS